jgi:hypothetical protein
VLFEHCGIRGRAGEDLYIAAFELMRGYDVGCPRRFKAA